MDNTNTPKDAIVSRIRKLLNLAENDAATNGEIANAMKIATDLMEQYQINKIELEQAAKTQTAENMAKKVATAGQSKAVPWMNSLAWAVATAIGSVKHYQTHERVSVGAFSKLEIHAGYCFYGPESDVELAVSVFLEWRTVIATIAVGKYGGCMRGNGRAYAIGFAEALHTLSKAMYKTPTSELGASDRKSIVPVSTMLAQKRNEASLWLEKTQNIKLSTKRNSTNVSSASALRAGRDDGLRSGFGINRTKALN